MKKYLVSIEFRYNYIDYQMDRQLTINTSTIGVFDDINDAYEKGNDVLIELESSYKLNVYKNGTTAKKERLSKFKKLVTNLGYLKTPFEFYMKLTTLDHVPVKDVLHLISKRLEH